MARGLPRASQLAILIARVVYAFGRVVREFGRLAYVLGRLVHASVSFGASPSVNTVTGARPHRRQKGAQGFLGIDDVTPTARAALQHGVHMEQRSLHRSYAAVTAPKGRRRYNCRVF
jgi:hypothetical protein